MFRNFTQSLCHKYTRRAILKVYPCTVVLSRQVARHGHERLLRSWLIVLNRLRFVDWIVSTKKPVNSQRVNDRGLRRGETGGRRKEQRKHEQSILFHYDYPRQLLHVMVKVKHLNVISCRRQGAYLGSTPSLYTWCNYNLILFPGCYKRVYFVGSCLCPSKTRRWL